jgi:hypothetical protein
MRRDPRKALFQPKWIAISRNDPIECPKLMQRQRVIDFLTQLITQSQPYCV